MENLDTILQSAFPAESLVDETAPANAWVIPGSGKRPRWILPVNHHAGLSVLRQWHPFHWHSKAKWSFLRAAYATGAIGKIPGVQPVHLRQIPSVENNFIPVFYIGTPTRVSKLVVTLVNPASCLPEQVLKVAVGELAMENIAHEASVLERLMSWKPGLAPAFIQCSPEQGQAIQTSLPGQVDTAVLSREHLRFLMDLQYDDVLTSLAKQVLCLSQAADVSSVSWFNEPEKAQWENIKCYLDDRTPLPAFWQHGDFSPWNALRHQGNITLVDWERSRPLGLPLQDLFHFLMMQKFIHNKPFSCTLHDSPVVQTFLKDSGLGLLSQATLNRLWVFYFAERWLTVTREETVEHSRKAFHEMLHVWEAVR